MKFNRGAFLFIGLLIMALAAGLPWTAIAQQPVQQPAKAPAQKQEQSVKPGINEPWKATEVQPLIGTLEAESREVYVHRDSLAALVGPRPGDAIADIGAGSGFMAEEFAKLVGPQGRVYAVDINPALLEFIAGRARQHGVTNITTVLTPEDSVALQPNSVDIVFICDTYHHFEYPRSTMAAVYRALRPGGQLVIVDFILEPGRTRPFILEHVRLGMDETIQEVSGFGFELTNIHLPTYLHENYVLRFRKAARVN